MHRRTFLRKAASAALMGGSAVVVGSLPASAQRYDRRIEIVNNTRTTIRTVNATNVGRRDWGVDLLGNEIIPPGRRMVINVEDRTGYCRYDFRAIFTDGRQVTRQGMNVCELARWVLT